MHKSRLTVALAVGATAAATMALGVSSVAMASADGADAVISTKLKGSEETSPGDPNGKGEFTAVLSGDTMCYAYYAKKIGTPSAAHIHDGDFGANGPVIITFVLPTKSGVSECKAAVPDAEDDNDTMSVSELAALKSASEGFYVNVDTAEFPAGSIRSQLV